MCKLLKEMFGVGAAQQETVLVVVPGHLCSPGTWSFNGSSEMSEESKFIGSTVDPEQSWLLQPEHIAPPSPATCTCWCCKMGGAVGQCVLQVAQHALDAPDNSGFMYF